MKKKLSYLVCCIFMISGLYGEEHPGTNTEQNTIMSDLDARSIIKKLIEEGIPNSSIDNSTLIEFESDYLYIANNVLSHYVKAQTAFHNRQAEEALKHIKKSLVVFETADAWALKARIYYQIGKRNKSEESWRKASELSSTYHINDFDPYIVKNNAYLFGNQQKPVSHQGQSIME